MKILNKIKVVHVFESYPLFYQPYIPPVIDALRERPELDLTINAYKGVSDKVVNVLPNYYYRRLIEKMYALFRKNPILNYSEINYLKNKTDIVHIQHSFLFSKILGLLELPEAARPKIIITLRGADTYIKPWMNEKWMNFYKNQASKVDAFITMSDHQKRYLLKWGIHENKIHVIPISFGERFDVEAKKPNKALLKIVSVFRMCWEKNIEGNLRVIKQLKEQGLAIQYDLYGDGADSGQVFYLIDKYQLKDCVIYHGRIENNRLTEQLKESDFILQLSHSESLGMSVIEAQSWGLPAIISNSDGLPETILPNESGYCVNPWDIEQAANYILALWNNPEMYACFSIAGITHAHTNFSTEKEVERLVELYHKLSS